MKIVVTGGAGFIGANLCRTLLADTAVSEIVAFDDLSTGFRDNVAGLDVELVEATILDPDALDAAFAGAHSIVHLGARGSVPRSVADPWASHEANASGTTRVLEAARRAGDVHVVAMAGDVLGEALSRVRLLRSMSGDVALSRSTVAGEANLQSVSGNVTASGVKATSLTLGSVTGNVRVTGSSSDRASVSTISGNVEFDAIPRAAGRYEIKTHGGNIIVVAPGRGGFEFEAATVKGDVRSDIPTEPAAPGRHYVRGSVGDASAFFDLSSFAGNIRVVRAGNEQK